MRFVVDAELPKRVARWLAVQGHDAVHTLDLPSKNRTSDGEIIDLACVEDRIVSTKDADFVSSHLIQQRPRKLLLISTGNNCFRAVNQFQVACPAGQADKHIRPDIVRHFTLFMETGGRTVKLVCRYQQFRAVQLAVQRMLSGKTRLEDGEQDRRGGIIWHTQGSGKSLTMVFLIRKMRSDPTLRRFKIVVVTDRRDLQKQLADTAALTDEVLTIVKPRKQGPKTRSSYEVLQQVVRREGNDLVFAMIQKYRGELLDAEAQDDEDDDTATRAPSKTKPLPELNTDQDILVLVDEAHRSHTNTAHANLMRALGFRWGSCGQAGNLNFHWATILLPASIVDYVVVHELAHLVEPNHTPEFRRRVGRALPEYEQRKTWLAEHGGRHVVL